MYEHYDNLTFERDGRVLTVTLEPGSPVNALTAAFHQELSTVFADIRHDMDTDVVIVRGAGKAFCAGADLHWLKDHDDAERDALFVEGRRIVFDLLDVPQPVIAAIEGPAVGFGATLALFCDIRFAASNVKIGDPHVLVGLTAGDGGAVIWPALVGAGRAKRYLMTGDIVDGPTAHAIGLVDELTEPGGTYAAASVMAQRLANGNTLAIRSTKAAVNLLLRDAANLVLDTSLAWEKECMVSPTFRGAVAAMLDEVERKA
jgi:enoyl-CoA hydratase